MTRPYSRYSTSTPESAGGYGDSPAPAADSYDSPGSYSGGAYGSYSPAGAATGLADRPDTDRLDNSHPDADHDAAPDDDDYDDDDVYAYDEPIDRRWIWVAGVAGAILLVAVICTVIILGGGDSGPVTATLTPAAPTTSHAAPTTTPSASAPSPTGRPATPSTSALAPETVTTVTPSPTAAVPTEAAPAVPAPDAVPAPASAAANTVVYRVTGNRPLLDLVTVIYTDSQGALQTDLNVALPWSKVVTLNPGVTLSSVTATSVTGQLNCSITDGSGAPIAAQNNNSMITTCTR
ncbi:hypothetical protein [Mycobacterium sp. OTB74]|uniref:hypothetical protein n=1 Tax=Mycobacterium sp. OTB74 TaxID=1853452 RepID=UPI002473236D|nr:hypothetical protein [Mycobacterium sp. OTB74]MDH6242503.1 hypothetical protein [Mycobacterium sp. OTB74]